MKPAVAVAAAATPNPTGGSTALLNVIGNNDLSTETGLTYTWTTTGSPPAAVGFSANGTNAAKNTTATFSKPGTYNFLVTITNSVGQTTTSTTSVTVTTTVVGRYLFYNNSAFDTSNDNAMAPDKVALLPGQAASFSNYSSYTRGINGIMIDIAGPVGTLTASDFQFVVGNDNAPSGWTPAVAPQSVTMRPGAGVGGSTRVEIVWADNAIANEWLQVTLKGGVGATSGLAAANVFYFGNAIGESGDSATDMKVNASDQLGARFAATSSAALTSPYDFNRDGIVDSNDESIARIGYTYYLNEVRLITPTTGAGPSLAPVIPTGLVIMPHPIVINPAPPSTIFVPISFLHPPIALPEWPLILVPWTPPSGNAPKGPALVGTLPALLTALSNPANPFPVNLGQPLSFIRPTLVKLGIASR